MYAVDIVNDAMFTVDKSNGNSALLGSIGFNANYAQDMAFDLSTDILYYAGFDGTNFTDQMYTVDLTSGLATPVAGNPNIGGGLGEVDAMSIATAGGPCSQPQDLPWLSFNPTSGTTAPGDTTNVSMGVDGTGSVDGDVLAGTMCTVSNDPDTRTVETAITINVTTAVAALSSTAARSTTRHPRHHRSLHQLADGLVLRFRHDLLGLVRLQRVQQQRWVRRATSRSTTAVRWATTSRCVWDGTSCSVLTSGAVIGPASTFGSGNAAAFLPGGSLYYGFSFVNANTSQVNYGYAKFTFTGRPASRSP